MEPVNSNVKSKTCAEQISSNCIAYSGPSLPCITVCKGASITEVIYNEGVLVCNLIDQLNSITPPDVPIIDFSVLDGGCVYSPTIVEWVCPVGQSFLADSSAFAVNGTPGYCQICPTPSTCSITTNVPVLQTTDNPVAKPTTLLGWLQLIINKIPCCDPCAGPNKTTP